ncbi:hypothetical protein BJI49_13560 [Acetobacter pasteurianus]|nr:hypothetical protein BJI49_13560 [Acetobacter pasteurianus]
MAETDLVQSLEVDIVAVDQTESATESAGRRLDALTEKGLILNDVLSSMGKTSKDATETLAEGADAAVGSFEKLGTQAVSRVGSLTKQLMALSAQRDSLRADLQKTTDEGLDTSGITENLEQVESQIGHVGAELQTVETNLQAAAIGQKAWNGQLGEQNALINGIREAEGNRAQALDRTTVAMAKGSAEAEKQADALAGVGQEFVDLTSAAGKLPDVMDQVSEAVTSGMNDMQRMVETGQDALNSMTAPDVDANVSGTVDIQSPDLSKTLEAQKKLKDSLGEVTNAASKTSNELSAMGNAGMQAADDILSGVDNTTAAMTKDVSDGISNIERMVNAEQEAVHNLSAPRADTTVSSTADAQTPDISQAQEQQEKIIEDLAK